MKLVNKIFSNDWTRGEMAWLFSAIAIIAGCGIYWGDSLVGIISAVTGAACVILVAKGEKSNYFFGLINVVLYIFLAYQAKLYGEVMLNTLYYVPMQFIGYYMWSKAGNGDGNFVAKSLSNGQRVILAVGSAVLIFGYSLLLQYLGGSLALIDSMSTVLSVIAMILMVKSFKEQWILWIIVNTVSIIMWVISIQNGTGDIATALMWTVYLVNAIWGYVSWNKASKK